MSIGDITNIGQSDPNTAIARTKNGLTEKVSSLAQRSFKFTLFGKAYGFRANTHFMRILVGGGVLSIGLWETIKGGRSWPGVPLVLCGALEVYFSWKSYIFKPKETSVVQNLLLADGEEIPSTSEGVIDCSDGDGEAAKKIVGKIMEATSSISEFQLMTPFERVCKILESWTGMRNAKLLRPGSSPKK